MLKTIEFRILLLMVGISLVPAFGLSASKTKKGAAKQAAPAAAASTAAATPAKGNVELPAIYLAETKGEVYVVHNEFKDKADAPQVLEDGDRILTRADSFAYLELRDGGVIEVDSNSDFTVKKAGYPAEGLRAMFNLAYGKVMALVKKLATAQSAFEIEAGGVVSGVRGTVYSVEYDGYKCPVIERTYEGTVVNRWPPKHEQATEAGHWNKVCVCGETTTGKLDSSEDKDFGRFKKAAEEVEGHNGKIQGELKTKIAAENQRKASVNWFIILAICHYHP